MSENTAEEKPVERKAECAIGFKTDEAHEQMLVEIVKHRRQTRRAFFETAIELEHTLVERERLANGGGVMGMREEIERLKRENAALRAIQKPVLEHTTARITDGSGTGRERLAQFN